VLGCFNQFRFPGSLRAFNLYAHKFVCVKLSSIDSIRNRPTSLLHKPCQRQKRVAKAEKTRSLPIRYAQLSLSRELLQIREWRQAIGVVSNPCHLCKSLSRCN
jgi:hypothetical protein